MTVIIKFRRIYFQFRIVRVTAVLKMVPFGTFGAKIIVCRAIAILM